MYGDEMRWRRWVLAMGWFASSLSIQVGPAQAQTNTDVSAARSLFNDAVADQEERSDFAAALEKFRRVQAIRDTPNVRFRIAACLEKLGRLLSAVESYNGVVALAGSDSKNEALVKAAQRKAAELQNRLPTLLLTLSSNAPADAVVELDHEPVSRARMGAPIPVNPGEHLVTGRASGSPPFDTVVTLPEAARFVLTVPLDARAGAPQTPSSSPPATSSTPTPTPAAPTDGSRETSTRHDDTVGIILVATGGALLVGGGATWLVRHSAIGTIKDDCPNGRCPTTTQDEVLSARSRADAMTPLGIALAGTGAIALGAGIYWLLRPSAAAASSSTSSGSLVGQFGAAPYGDSRGGGFALSGKF